MRSIWIFKTFYHRSIDLISNIFVSISPSGSSQFPTSNAIKWDDKTASWINVFSKTNTDLTFKFNKFVLFNSYRIKVMYANRYMTGWRLDVSYDGVGFTSIDSKEENFCSKNYIHDNIVDCGELTTRTFKVPLTTAKVIRLVLTKPDSCGTYCI